jgi:hypothetical protein
MISKQGSIAAVFPMFFQLEQEGQLAKKTWQKPEIDVPDMGVTV